MQIKITKKGNRSQLTCVRQDGTFTSQNLGPGFPHHDMAHFIVESNFKLDNGFYGLIRQGKSIEELNDKEVIKTLGPDVLVAEILTRNLQAVSSDAVSAKDYEEIVKWEMEQLEEILLLEVSEKVVLEMQSELEKLASEWNDLAENESLTFTFENYTQLR